MRKREIARKAYQDLLNHYDSKPGDAKQLLARRRKRGRIEFAAGRSRRAHDLAALTMLTNSIFNLDEVLTK